LRVCHLSDRHHGGIEDRATFGERRFTLAAELCQDHARIPDHAPTSRRSMQMFGFPMAGLIECTKQGCPKSSLQLV